MMTHTQWCSMKIKLIKTSDKFILHITIVMYSVSTVSGKQVGQLESVGS